MSQTPIAVIVGAWGFLGRHVVQRLAEAGWRVRAAGRRPQRGLFLKMMGGVGQIDAFHADLQRPESLKPLLEGASLVVNLVGILHERWGERFSSIHERGAGRLASMATDAGVKGFIHISALGADRESQSLYLKSKGRGEDAARSGFAEARILRPSLIFGAEDSFFNRFARMALLSPVIPLIGAETKFQPVYVDDMARAVAILADPFSKDLPSPPVHHAALYEIGGSRVATFRELMTLMLQEIQRERMLFPIPFPLARPLATIAQFVPGKPITPDQIEALRHDNVVSARARREKRTLEGLGIAPETLERILPAYLRRYRRHAAI